MCPSRSPDVHTLVCFPYQAALGRSSTGAAMLRSHAPAALPDLIRAVGNMGGKCVFFECSAFVLIIISVSRLLAGPRGKLETNSAASTDNELCMASLHEIAGIVEGANPRIQSSFESRLATAIAAPAMAADAAVVHEAIPPPEEQAVVSAIDTASSFSVSVTLGRHVNVPRSGHW